MSIIGISCFYHDSAAALISNEGEILAAAQEERFSRKKHDSRFPINALRYCLKSKSIGVDGIFERFWAFLEPKNEKKRISRINASNKKIPMFEGTFKVLRGIQGVWFFANMCRITYSWNAHLTIFLSDYYFLK